MIKLNTYFVFSKCPVICLIMSKFLSFLKVIGCIALLCFVIPIKINGPDDVETKFNDYLKKFNKTYSNETEYYRRLQIFQVITSIFSCIAM